MDEFRSKQELVQGLLSARALREPAWHDCRKWLCPWRGALDGRVGLVDSEDSLTLFNSIAMRAILKGASGMTSGMTPRNSPWFRPEFADRELSERHGAREWLDALNLRMNDCLANGGFYQAIQSFNTDLLWAGCALLYSETGACAPLRFESVQVGSFCVSLNQEGRPEAVCRLVSMSCADLARRFGEDRLSPKTRQLLARKPYAEARLWHLCQTAEQGRWPVASWWWEEGGSDFLSRHGFYEMPYFFACWHEGTTAYGTGPGDESWPDAWQLDNMERSKLAGLGKLVNPPVTAPPQFKDSLDLDPGGINYTPGQEMIRPIFDLSPYASAIRHIQDEIAIVSNRLQESLMASIFASMPLEQRPRDMSATEFLERKREALQQLGPVISAYEPNVLTPVLQRVLKSLDRQQKTPPPPQGLEGESLAMKIDFISPMANALRQSGADAARALLADVAAIYKSSQNAEIFDKIDLDQTIDELARAIGAPGGMVRADEDVEALRQKRAEAEASRRQAEDALSQLQMGRMAADLGQALPSLKAAQASMEEADLTGEGLDGQSL